MKKTPELTEKDLRLILKVLRTRQNELNSLVGDNFDLADVVSEVSWLYSELAIKIVEILED